MTTLPEDAALFQLSPAWRATFPQAHVGFLALAGVTNPALHPALEAAKRELEAALRARFRDPQALAAWGPLPAYRAYYKAFDQSYHVQAQIASVALKGKPIPTRAALVEAMFMAELQTGLLTAGHDLDHLVLPVTVDVGRGDEAYVLLRGVDAPVRQGDMLMRDGVGVISSILAGPDRRTQISAAVSRVLFATYAPAGIGAAAVAAHLEAIEQGVRLLAPTAHVLARRVLAGGDLV